MNNIQNNRSKMCHCRSDTRKKPHPHIIFGRDDERSTLCRWNEHSEYTQVLCWQLHSGCFLLMYRAYSAFNTNTELTVANEHFARHKYETTGKRFVVRMDRMVLYIYVVFSVAAATQCIQEWSGALLEHWASSSTECCCKVNSNFAMTTRRISNSSGSS